MEECKISFFTTLFQKQDPVTKRISLTLYTLQTLPYPSPACRSGWWIAPVMERVQDDRPYIWCYHSWPYMSVCEYANIVSSYTANLQIFTAVLILWLSQIWVHSWKCNVLLMESIHLDLSYYAEVPIMLVAKQAWKSPSLFN